MTDIAPTPGVGLAIPEGEVIPGMEDYDTSTDAVMPTIRIDHKENVFVDALSKETFKSLDVVLLGLIKQRVLWEPDVDESNKGPLCRSYDFKIGRPDQDRFPWAKSGFEKGTDTLPCEACPLQVWGSHPNRDAPWCSEQHTFALLRPTEGGGFSPALLTIQRSGIKPSRTYLTAFQNNRQALFTVITTITLDHRRRGTVDFSVPMFAKGEATGQDDWGFFATQARAIRNFVQTPRTRDEEEGEVETPEAAASDPADPAAGAAVAPDEDDLPF